MSAEPRPSGSTSSGSGSPPPTFVLFSGRGPAGLTSVGCADAEDLTLVETRVERTDPTIRIVHVFEYGPRQARLQTEPYEGYGGG